MQEQAALEKLNDDIGKAYSNGVVDGFSPEFLVRKLWDGQSTSSVWQPNKTHLQSLKGNTCVP